MYLQFILGLTHSLCLSNLPFSLSPSLPSLGGVMEVGTVKRKNSHIQMVGEPPPLSQVKRSDDRKYVTCICRLPSPWERNFRGGIKRFYKLITTFRNLN